MSYPIVPEVVRRYTIRPGSVDTAETVEVVKGSEAVATAVFVIGTSVAGSSGYSKQLTALRGNNREWAFGTAALWRLLTWDGSTDPREEVYDPSLWPAPTLSETATGFTLTWSDANLGDIVVTGSLTTSTGELFLTATATPAAALLATNKAWGFDFPFLRVLPYRVARKHSLNIVSGIGGGRIHHAITNPLNAATYQYGLKLPTGGSAPEPETTGTSPSAVPAIAIYDREIETGLLIRSAETRRYLEFTYDPGDTYTDVWVRHFPADNFAATSVAVSTAIVLQPYVGGAYEAAVKFREAVQREEWECISRGKVWYSTDFPSDAKNLNAILWFSLPAPSDPTRAAEITYIGEMATAAKAKFGSGVMVLIYNIGDAANITVAPPDVAPVGSDLTTLVSTLSAAGILVSVYQIPFAVSFTSPWWTANSGTATQYLLLKRDQSNYTFVTADGTLRYLTAADAAARTLVLAEIAEVFAAFGLTVDGMYLDDFGGASRADYRTALSSADKGIGSLAQINGMRTFLSDLVTAYRLLNPNIFFMTEFPDIRFMDLMHFFGPFTGLDLLEFGSSYPWFKMALGEYYLSTTFQGVTCPDSADAAVLQELRIELDLWNLCRMINTGATMLFWDGAGTATQYPMFADAGDASYDSWVTYRKPVYDFAAAVIGMMDTTFGALRKYARGRKLRPLDNLSWDWYIQTRPYLATYYEFGQILAIPGPRIDSSVSVSDEELGQPIGILLTNFRNSDETVTITLDPAVYAPLLNGRRYLVKNTAGVRSLVATCDWGVSQEVTVPARSAVLYELVTISPVV